MIILLKSGLLSASAGLALLLGPSPSHGTLTSSMPTANPVPLLWNGMYWDLVENAKCSDNGTCVTDSETNKCYQRAENITVGTDVYVVTSCYSFQGAEKGKVKSKKSKV